jgi:ketosteroid isomerase-like protein
MKDLFVFISMLFFVCPAFSQNQDKVSQLVAAENYFAALVKEKGTQKGFLSVSDENTIVFRPGPVSAEKFYKDQPDTSRGLSWEPVFAKISKSGDWGFTTGPFIFKAAQTGQEFYGDYLSVWRKNSKNVWKLALDLGVSHAKPTKKPELTFLNAATQKFQVQKSDARLKQREEIVFSSDKLYSTTLRANNDIAFMEFLHDDCRLLFPGSEPIIGIADIHEFWVKQKAKLRSEPSVADRALSGELAYTYGTATVEKGGTTKNYNYVRIWSVQAGYVWKVIAEVYSAANPG